MTTIGDVLRDADPLGRESSWPAEARLRTRQIVVGHARPPARPRQAIARLAVAVAMVVLTAAAGALLWTYGSPSLAAAIRFEVRVAETAPAPGLREAQVAGENRVVYLHEETVAANRDIAEARIVPGRGPSFDVAIRFTADGAAKMQRATEGHVGRPLAILLDGEVVSTPTVRARIGREGLLNGSFTKSEAERIANGILGQ
jgi:hypothetical protein